MGAERCSLATSTCSDLTAFECVLWINCYIHSYMRVFQNLTAKLNILYVNNSIRGSNDMWLFLYNQCFTMQLLHHCTNFFIPEELFLVVSPTRNATPLLTLCHSQIFAIMYHSGNLIYDNQGEQSQGCMLDAIRSEIAIFTRCQELEQLCEGSCYAEIPFGKSFLQQLLFVKL